MSTFPIFKKTSTFGGVYKFILANRLQILLTILIIPSDLIHPYMIWGIIASFILSQINLIILSKWFASDFSSKGYQGFIQLFGKWKIRFLVMIALIPILIKINVFTLFCVKIVHQFIFPSMNINWLLFFIFLTICYVAFLGMSNTIQFGTIAFLGSFWIILLFYPFFIPPLASLHDLYPLIPTDWSKVSWKGSLFLLSAFSGPEYIICLAPWLHPNQKMLRSLTLANLITTVEYLIVFIASLLFYGANYLNKVNFPAINMTRYLQSPFLERIDIILISAHMFNYVFNLSIFLLILYGAIRIILGRIHKQTTRTGFIFICSSVFVLIVLVNAWLWKPGIEQNNWVYLELCLEGFTYWLVPSLLLITVKRKAHY